MAAVVLDGRLGELSGEARVYPAHLLTHGGTGLCLFAARFWGVNDAIHMARARMDITLVDLSPRVFEMGEIYGCEAHLDDAWDAATYWSAEGLRWDAVSVDTYTGDAVTRSMDSLDLWTSLAREVVTCTYTPGVPYTVPDGWVDAGKMIRNPRGGIAWLILTRA